MIKYKPIELAEGLTFLYKNGKMLLYSTICVIILYFLVSYHKKRGEMKRMATLVINNDNKNILKEMKKSFEDFKKLPEDEQKIIARTSLMDAGILDKNGYVSKIYRNLGD